MATPRSLGFRMPAEWEPQSATWLSWPSNTALWPGHYGLIPAKFAEFAAAISRFQPVRINAAGKLRAELKYGRIDEILATGLHAYLTQFLDRVNDLGLHISRDFLVPSGT